MADGKLQFKYQDDFEQEDDKKNVNTHDINIQTESPQRKKTEEENQNYQSDFNNDEEQLKKQEEIRIPIRSNPDREKMIQQNIKLKTQIFQLAKQMDEIIDKQKARKKKYGIHAEDQEDTQQLKHKRQQLKKQHLEIMQLKNKIVKTKRQLQEVYDSRGIQEKEDQLKNLQIQLENVKKEKEGLLNVKKQQLKAISILKDSQEYEQRIKNLKIEQSKLRQQCANLSQKLIENQRVLRKNHEQYVLKHNKLKEMELKIKQHQNKKNKKNQQEQKITTQMINSVDNEINELEKQKKNVEKSWVDKIQAAEQQLSQRKVEDQKKKLILKEKQRELKLNQIKIKELKKLISHHKQEQKQKSEKKNSNVSEMKQYRHKRNIKYLEKS